MTEQEYIRIRRMIQEMQDDGHYPIDALDLLRELLDRAGKAEAERDYLEWKRSLERLEK